MSRLAAVLCGIAIALAIPKVGSGADISPRSYSMNIPPQSLGPALQQLAKQSGLQIIFLSQVAEGHEAPALSGTYTAEAALRVLLIGTGLTFQPLNDRTIQVFAQPSSAAAAGRDLQPPDPLSEVEIQAQREQLWRMRDEIRSIEDSFFEEYNALNTDDDFDVHCNLRAGQRIRNGDRIRICRPAFVERSVMSYGGHGGSGSQGGSADAGLYGIPGGLLSGSAVAQGHGSGEGMFAQSAKWAAYEKHMLALITRYPQLRKIVSDHEALEKRYEEIRREKLQRKWFIQ